MVSAAVTVLEVAVGGDRRRAHTGPRCLQAFVVEPGMRFSVPSRSPMFAIYMRHREL